MNDREVVLLEWPSEEVRRQSLADRGALRILNIGPDIGVPLLLDDAEDWIRRPFSPEDLDARVRALRSRRVIQRPGPPRIDEYGILRSRGMQCVLSEVEAALMGALLADDAAMTSRTELVAAAWPGRSASRNALDIAMMRLRRTVEPYGVMIRTARGRGYMVDSEQ